MNNRTTFFKREIIFGTYFIGQWIDLSGKKNIEESFNLLAENPFKYIPMFMHLAINSSAEIQGLEKVELFDVIDEVDNVGGIASEEIQRVLSVFTNSIKVDLGKQKPVAKRLPRK